MNHNWTVKIKLSAKGDLRKIIKSNLRNRFMQVVSVLENNTFEATQSFEKLLPPGDGLYSRRINSQQSYLLD